MLCPPGGGKFAIICVMKVKSALVAEDNTKHYERYAALLSGMGLRVERACDGVDALGGDGDKPRHNDKGQCDFLDVFHVDVSFLRLADGAEYTTIQGQTKP